MAGRILIIFLTVSIVSSSASDDMLYGLIGSEVSITYDIPMDKCNNDINIFRDTQVEVNFLFDFSCEDFKDRSHHDNGIYKESKNNFDGHVIARPDGKLQLVFHSLQEHGSHTYEVHIPGFGSINKHLTGITNDDLLVNLSVNGNTSMRELQRGSLYSFQVLLQNNAPKNPDVKIWGEGMEKQEYICCNMSLQITDQFPETFYVTVSFPQVAHSKAATFNFSAPSVNNSVTDRTAVFIGAVVGGFVLLLIVIIIIIILWKTKKICRKNKKSQGDFDTEDITMKHYDAIIVHTDATKNDKVRKIRDLMQREVRLDDWRPSIALLDDILEGCSDRMRTLEIALKHSTFVLLLVTEDFSEDKEAIRIKNDVLVESLQTVRQQNRLIPLRVLPKKDKNNEPREDVFGIRCLKGFEIQAWWSKSGQIDKDEITRMVRTFAPRKDQKVKREEETEEKRLKMEEKKNKRIRAERQSGNIVIDMGDGAGDNKRNENIEFSAPDDTDESSAFVPSGSKLSFQEIRKSDHPGSNLLAIMDNGDHEAMMELGVNPKPVLDNTTVDPTY